MHIDFKILEVTKDNAYKYTSGIVELEKTVLCKMEQEGEIGQLFITGKDGIEEYINSKNNHVMVAVKQNAEGDEQVISACYITKGQTAFTYNDITKYFKCGEHYQEYIKSKYTDDEYERNLRETYINKICAFCYARDIILKNKGMSCLEKINEQEKNKMLLKMIEDELNDKNNRFHEKSDIREKLNENMSLYMKIVKKDAKRYEEFYWIDYSYLKNLFSEKSKQQKLTNDLKQKLDGENIKVKSEKDLNIVSNIETYDKILNYQKYKIYDKSNCSDERKYFNANTSNTIELDTYITHPNERKKGLAKILVFEGIKKALMEQLYKTNHEEVFLMSTLHKDNVSSKNVSEFFELNDYIFVNRRNGRDRQVHIVRIPREEITDYINRIQHKIEKLYNYNKNVQKQQDL